MAISQCAFAAVKSINFISSLPRTFLGAADRRVVVSFRFAGLNEAARPYSPIPAARCNGLPLAARQNENTFRDEAKAKCE